MHCCVCNSLDREFLLGPYREEKEVLRHQQRSRQWEVEVHGRALSASREAERKRQAPGRSSGT